ncbi:hypothetical protein [Hymenobacter yonginensis]|uniref:Uncharacterized protein n=1 Tax=Hymenobacter yonginensis TaxID=748197 RepID=A0ABY7PV34_9BACT|nr:hypothetical protein [Hymenobacter yonginensis]WBO86781.1 hypothetical protein O9Z63_20055 [Hymenobacter yonginensis]
MSRSWHSYPARRGGSKHERDAITYHRFHDLAVLGLIYILP